jgi:hypothetical protein
MGNVGTAPGTTTITLPGGLTVALSDWIDDKQWTTVQLDHGLNEELQAFATGRSQPIVGGTRNNTAIDTNIKGTGLTGLNKAWEFMVYGWAVEYIRATRSPSTLAGYSDPLNSRTVFELNRRIFLAYVYNGKDYCQGLIQDFPAGHGIYMNTTLAAQEIAQNGVPSPRDRVALVLPVRERELLSYMMSVNPVIALSIDQEAQDGGADLDVVDMRIIKNGLIKRIVN